MEREGDSPPPADEDNVQDVNELLDQFGDATEAKGANLEELERRTRELDERER